MARTSDDKEKEKPQRGAYICTDCKNEFEGTSCPECGNAKKNLKLAQDGIEHDMHKASHLFGSVEGLRPAEDYLMDSQQLERKRAKMQMEELDDNLREAYVLKSKVKLHELQMQQRRREIEAKKLEEQSEEYLSGRSSIPPSQAQAHGGDGHQEPYPQMPFMQNLSPQAIFMQQLMRMDGKKRAEFIEQLTEADPGALANLSAMFQQSQPQYPQMNPNAGANPNNPYGYPMMPPWMMQQQPQQQHQTDPIALVTAIFELSQKMQPQRDDSVKETLQEFKGAIQKVHDRIDMVATKERDKDMNPIIEKISSLEQKLANSAGKSSVVEQVTELTQLVDGLEKVGLVTRPGRADKTVDDELKLKEFEFKKDMKTKEMENESRKVEAEQNKLNFNQTIVSSLLQRGIQKGLREREEENEDKPSLRAQGAPVQPRVNRVRTVQPKPPEPVEVIDEVQSDAGIVRETRRPVKKADFAGD